jgi:hypothetical protein
MRTHLRPADAPELNPVEPIGGHAKTNPMANFAPAKLIELLTPTPQATNEFNRNPELLCSFVQHGVLSLLRFYKQPNS